MIEKLVQWLVVTPANLFGNLQSLFLFAVRLWVSWDFLKSGWLKVTNWQNTLFLFQNEYHTPVLPPDLAAVMGAGGELFFPALLIVGLTSRLGAIGLSAVNVMAVVSYANVLLSEGFEAALGQHVMWGFGLVVLIVFGPGKASLDHLLVRAPRRAPSMEHAPAV